ncbi:AraC family transcriptional activator of pobA [Parabacteroides sp. PF5-5]|uniref:helix-turn-helix domain-containing protein n=1 Tax=unclassified Parabacteroides TaxID=2649774 RepID=UPI0024735054|nr:MULTISPECIES: helix-turn-helix transcriptional regulator [unclassified Parabacteroides]MDH6304738.1 AraC family transcriptional activator of pobA [Parabacteroides sp. PH5-39]MDH6315647.1 AraC family transcriptional activator of pobA [Parabacteroides sp. PF5-13]MDH6319308.1 AraC family transcriptional activator of pobA [Parabacteroides sp. PH5-13]MDH6323039.1 AraC family transcriptional activator of pobA [Parabacteroides sp. PH5-8]MDH6326840.1 AraC family transcriptional activator of pobA [P
MDTELVFKTFAFVDKMTRVDKFQNVLTMGHIDAIHMANELEERMPAEVRDVNSFLLILVRSGQAEIKLDYETYRIAPDKLAFIMPSHIFQLTEMSDDFNAQFLIIDKLFLGEVVHEKKGFYNYMSLKRKPVTPLEPEENAGLQKALLLLQEKIRSRTHAFQQEVVHNATTGLLLELLGVFVKKNNDLVQPILSRKEEIVDEFLKLLSKYTRERRPLTFYADKLFITPQYLSSTLKEQTGKTGSKWLADALIMEAKKLIKSPHSTIQAVAYTLNFSDQSTFGKFFKKSIGVSPLVYRRL